jgi:hypothetical protein
MIRTMPSCPSFSLTILRTVACIMAGAVGLAACGGGSGASPSPAGSGEGQRAGATPVASGVQFVDQTSALGLDYFIEDGGSTGVGDAVAASGGLALVDIDNDGLYELFVAHGRTERGRLFSYDGERFNPEPDNLGITPTHIDRAGYFIDLDADGWKDFISVQEQLVEVFLSDREGQFIEATSVTNLNNQRSTYSMAAADYDLDGDVDLFFSHWRGLHIVGESLTEYLWQNDAGHLTDVSDRVMIRAAPADGVQNRVIEFSYTPSFADIDDDGYPDILLASDGGNSQVLRNTGGHSFVDATTDVISDRNGMGGTVADYDRDGDLDWFVSSIHDLDGTGEGTDTGNRLYRNEDGLGNFVDVTDQAGVRDGDWGWGSCFADFDNDGFVDLFLTNGMPESGDRYANDPSRLFMSNGDGTFFERAARSGISHTAQGRGIVCADYDGDGRVDIMIANNGRAPTVYQNRTVNDHHYLQVRLVGRPGNQDAIGARVTVELASGTQLQEVQLGTWYLSQGPTTLHFGLGSEDSVTAVEIRWPDASLTRSRFDDIAADTTIVFVQP